MKAELLSVDARKPGKPQRFDLRQLGRLIGLIRPYRKYLVVGLIATVLFAGLHTLSIATVFPVFKILLEREGLQGWVNRTIAGDRLNAELAPPDEAGRVFVIRTHGDDAAQQLSPGDSIRDPDGRPVPALLQSIANAENDATINLNVNRRGEMKSFSIALAEPEYQHGLMQRGVALAGAGDATDAGKLRTLLVILTVLTVVVLIANVFRYLGEVLVARAVLRSMMDLRAKLYERTLQLPMSFFTGQPTADVVTRFVQDIQEIQRGMMTFFGKFLREPLRAIFILGLAFTLDWRLTLVLIIVVPITVAIFWAVGRKVKKANHRLLRGYGYMVDALTTSLHNLRVVKAYTAEEQERKRLWMVDEHMFKQQLRLAQLQAFVSPMIETIAVIAGSLGTVWLASRVLNQQLEPSTFLALGVALGMLFDPLRKLTDVYVRIQRSTAGAERIFHVIDEPIEMEESEGSTVLPTLSRGIECHDVTFTYPGADAPALVDINLSIACGETIALVGPNGSGKTTLASLLPRLFVPQAGSILFDGVDIREADLISLRRQIGLVSQEAIIFAGTPIENICFGAAEYDRARAIDAARRAYADEFIRNIPGEYDAALGERGTTLSGGQRQRLAIARAIYRDAPILIFDEATSQIDTESEQKIQEALTAFAKGRTTIIIAHRLSTILFADRIVVMEGGRIIDIGPHRELFERCTLYRTLCETQFLAEPEGATQRS